MVDPISSCGEADPKEERRAAAAERREAAQERREEGSSVKSRVSSGETRWVTSSTRSTDLGSRLDVGLSYQEYARRLAT
jgi:hypothetical protein